MSLDKHVLWVEKYRPKTLAQYVFQNEAHQQSFERMVRDKSIPQLILAGVQGTGKTTLAQILISAMDLDPADICTINASHERGIDTFREKIYNFATSMALGRFKIVHLEEADRLTPEAQDALKAFMEEVSDSVRFIMTTNHLNKLTPPIRSRCQEYSFKAADKLDVTEQMIYMLRDEKVKFTMETLNAHITAGYPDIRKIINLLQQHSIDGVLEDVKSSGSGEWRVSLMDLLASNSWEDARKLACANVTNDEWESLFRYLYENIATAPKFGKRDKWEEAIILIAEHLYKHTFVADPEINAAALFIRLGQL